ncbi:alpha-1,2-fucosyltransferase [Flavobacterium sp. LS1R49]|uniref:Alpha-1,2-fucosyltransferase n=1 Tax=Flavobacterium shii TaxID=2987687 RepID=A0A9X2ZDQ2_9FLAO|nr:alpha-1,2-fucosyltransferase [Flavobacterium shii]MCV9927465.1 alpha-1,2-fucosyltransferase [Flavobacterium shii]
MITFSKLEKKGHLGNQLFQIASTLGIAIKNNQEFCYPKWSYNASFTKSLPLIQNLEWIALKEKQFHYDVVELDTKNYDLEGWFQSEKYFDIDSAKSYFQFKSSLLTNLKIKYKDAFAKKNILISIRRGDFVDHPDYFQLPIQYYIHALISNFPDWSKSSLIILSDDIEYCKYHFSFLENAYFANQLSAIEQLALSSMCDDFIISNSTFSWWCAWLGEKVDSKVIRPLHYFTESKRKVDNDQDYFPERWQVFNHLNLKLDLENTQIVLTKENLILEKYLQCNFNFINQNAILKLDATKQVDFERNGITLIINDCVLPPFLIYVTKTSLENSVGYVKGSFFNISKYLDQNLFQKQFDYGLFAKILNKKNSEKKTKKIGFVLIRKNQEKIKALNKNFENLDFEKLGFRTFCSFAGKIKGFLECKYYLKVQMRKTKVFVKTKIKNIIKPKK